MFLFLPPPHFTPFSFHCLREGTGRDGEQKGLLALLGFVFQKPNPCKRVGFEGEAEAWRTSEEEQGEKCTLGPDGGCTRVLGSVR